MGINLAAFGAILGDGESVLRGLNPSHCEDGVPTEGCFILKRDDPPNMGPSFGVLAATLEEDGIAPIGAACGISFETFASVLPSGSYGIARLNVGVVLQPIRDRAVGFVHDPEDAWGQHRAAHAMLTGYQVFTNRERRDLQRHLAKIAAQSVLKEPGTAT